MISHKFVISNGTTYSPITDNAYTISKTTHQRAAAAFQASTDGYLTSATVKLINNNNLLSKSGAPKAKLILISGALTGTVNLDKMKSVGDVTASFTDTNVTITAKSSTGIKVAKDSIYAVILESTDKDFSISAPATVTGTATQPVLIFDNKSGFANTAFTWIVDATHYFEITPVISATVASPTPTSTPTASAGTTPTPTASASSSGGGFR